MKNLRPSEMAGMDATELDKHLGELKKELMKIKGGLASGGIPEGVGKTKEIKRTIARILTVKGKKK